MDRESESTQPAGEGVAPIQELRRSYHDGIAQLREQTVSMVSDATSAAEVATQALLDLDADAGRKLARDLSGAAAMVASVDSEVLALLALQAPVARDLRLILASRDVAQTAALCVGLCQTLATRAGSASGVLSGDLRVHFERAGMATAALLRRALGAWVALDDERARAVMAGAEACRTIQKEFLTVLLGLRDVPVEAAVDLGMASRAFGRLTDHAAEIAERVIFAVRGTSPGVGRAGTELGA